MIGVVTTIGVSLILGIPLLSLFRDRPQTKIGFVAVSLLLGYGLVFFALLTLSVLSISWSRTSLLSSFVLMVVLLSLTSWKRGRWFSKSRPKPRGVSVRNSSAHFIALFSITVLLIGYGLFATVASPVENDYAAIWGLKARVFWSGGGVDLRFLESDANVASHPGYPLLLPLIIDSGWTIEQKIDERAIGLFWVTFAACTIALIREGLVREGCSRAMASLGAAACSGLALSPWIGLADAAMMTFGTAAAILIRSSLREERTVGVMPAILLGLAACTKNEGLTLTIAVAVALTLAGYAREIRNLWPAVLTIAPWAVLRALHRIPAEFTEGDLFARLLSRMQQPQNLIAALIEFHPGRLYFWIVVLATIVWNARLVARRERFLVGVVLTQLIFFVAAFLTTPHDVLWHVRWSWPRIGTQVLPLIGFLVVTLLTGRITTALAARMNSHSRVGGE